MSKTKQHKEEQLELTLPLQDSPQFIITVGIPASGKTTWAYIVAGFMRGMTHISERDSLRVDLHCPTGDLNEYKYTKAREKAVTDEQEVRIKRYAKEGRNIIVADTNLNTNTRERLIKLAEELGYVPEIKVFDTPLHECVKRNLKRSHTVPESVLIQMSTQLRKYLGKPLYEAKKGLPSCVLIDLDGSLANMKDARGPFEWDKVLLDKPRENIVRLIQKWANNYRGDIIIFTGRDGVCLEDSKKWLKAHNVPFNKIFIRPEGNTENDAIIKERMYVDNIHNKYNVDFVLDDRSRVVSMWCSLGLDVLDVGNGVSDF